MKNMTPAEYAAKLTDDPVFFCRELWRAKGWDQVAPIEWAAEDMIRFLALGSPRRILLAPRGIGKTHMMVGVVLWRLFRDPNERIQIVSKTGGHVGEAAMTLNLIGQCIKGIPWLHGLMPADGDLDSTVRLEVGPASAERTPSIQVKGIDSQIVGTRASILIPDDVETPGNTETPAARAKLYEKVQEFRRISSYGQREIVYLGTYHPDPKESIYYRLAQEQPDFEVRTYPVAAPSPDHELLNLAPVVAQAIADGRLKPGDPVFPKQYDRQRIDTECKAAGETGFLKQYMLAINVASIVPYPLKLRDLIVWDIPDKQAPLNISWGTTTAHGSSTAIDTANHAGFTGDALYRPIKYTEEWGNYSRVVMAIDPSGSGQNKTGVAIAATVGGLIYLRYAGGLKGSSGSGMDSEVRAELCRLARRYGVRDILIESNFGQDTFAQLMEADLKDWYVKPGQMDEYPNGWSCHIITERAKGQKEVRICDTLEPIMQGHRLVVDTQTALSRDFQYQLTHMTRTRGAITDAAGGDDIIDAVAMACGHVNQELARPVNDAAAERRAAWLRERKKRHEALFGSGAQPNWITRV